VRDLAAPARLEVRQQLEPSRVVGAVVHPAQRHDAVGVVAAAQAQASRKRDERTAERSPGEEGMRDARLVTGVRVRRELDELRAPRGVGSPDERVSPSRCIRVAPTRTSNSPPGSG
jgi:hypothetical protein